MLKLLIVDDEETICQAIANLIDWKACHIQLIGTCFDGVEAYHAILDENPDIVMTDIRMPGISGLDLIERISRTDLRTQFIVLSGYGEFDYAKRAMKCGVRHYLLKPCTEEQILECIQEITRDFYKIAALKEGFPGEGNPLTQSLHKALIQNMLREGLSSPEISDAFFEPYEHYLDLTNMPCQFCCVYYLEERSLDLCLERFSEYRSLSMPEAELYMLYVRNILIFFFPGMEVSYASLDSFFRSMSLPSQTVAPEYSRKRYSDLKSLLTMLIPKLKRYDVLYFLEDDRAGQPHSPSSGPNGAIRSFRRIPTFNYGHIVEQINLLIPDLASPDPKLQEEAHARLAALLYAVSSKDFLLQLSDNLIISLGTHLPSRTLPEITDFLYELRQENDLEKLVFKVLGYSKKLTQIQPLASRQYSAFISRLIDYVYEHYSNPDLTLKWISENYLYMNVSYISRSFTKETGKKFSTFLMELRVQKAKELLSAADNERIQSVAELVGCGNTPYYFSKIFKKCTGLTPSAYVKKKERG